MYFKNLINEVGSKTRVKAEVQRTGKGGAVRLVGGGGEGEGQENMPWGVMADGGWVVKRPAEGAIWMQ